MKRLLLVLALAAAYLCGQRFPAPSIIGCRFSPESDFKIGKYVIYEKDQRGPIKMEGNGVILP